jgi:hypothetical protein
MPRGATGRPKEARKDESQVSLTDKHRHRTLSGIYHYEETPMIFINGNRTTFCGKKTTVIFEFELRDI